MSVVGRDDSVLGIISDCYILSILQMHEQNVFKGDIHNMIFIADYVGLYSRVPAWVLVSGGIGRAFRVTIQLLFHEELRQSDCAGTETSIVTMIICH